MSPVGRGLDDSSPGEQVVSTHSSKMQENIGRFDERIKNIEKNMVTQEYLAKSRLENLAGLVYKIIVPAFFILIGYLIKHFSP